MRYTPFVITLKGYTQRREAAEKGFGRRGWPIEFYEAVRDSEDPGRGCFTSHLNCMKRALSRDQDWCMVFEDDAVFLNYGTNEWNRSWEEALEFIESSHDWDVLMLGFCGGDYVPSCMNAARISGSLHLYDGGCLCTHAVVYSRRFMERFVREYSVYRGYEIDDMLREIPGIRMMTVRPMLFGQNISIPSSIEDKDVVRSTDAVTGLQKLRGVVIEGFGSPSPSDRTWMTMGIIGLAAIAALMVVCVV